jgi:hypothetical protein
MNLNLKKLLQWTPKGLSIFMVLFWLVVLFIYDFGAFTAAAMMVWFLLFLTTLVAWKNASLGGNFYILLGVFYLIFISHPLSSITFLSASPFFIVGILFITNYYYEKGGENVS